MASGVGGVQLWGRVSENVTVIAAHDVTTKEGCAVPIAEANKFARASVEPNEAAFDQRRNCSKKVRIRFPDCCLNPVRSRDRIDQRN